MISNDFIHKELGIAKPISESLLEISTKFTMAFYYSEKLFFSRNASTREAKRYSSIILSKVGGACSKEIDHAFDYFRQRYTSDSGYQMRLYALTMEQSESSPHQLSSCIEEYLRNSKGDPEKMLAVCLTVIIRLRHNLLHANKYESMMKSAKEQEELLGVGYSLLSSLVYAVNNTKK